MHSIKKKHWDKTIKEEEVYLYTLKNDFLEIEILNFGGTIKSIFMPDKNGVIEDIVLGFDNLKDYEENLSAHFGAIVGRNAGRIRNGQLKINDNIYELFKNNSGNNLHSYPGFFGSKIWDIKEEIKKDEVSLILTRISPHLESNFPSEVDFEVKYTLKNNDFIIEYKGHAKEDTYINLTNHSYFNLSGNSKEDIGNQIIRLFSDEFIEVDKNTLPSKIVSVQDRIFDLKKGKLFSEIFNSSDEQINIVNNGLDHPFIFSSDNKFNGLFSHEESGRNLKIITDQPVGVIYTGNYLSDITGLVHKKNIKNHFGFCIETQDYPDVINSFPNKAKLYNNNFIYKQKTIFSFYLDIKKTKNS